jgi:hypothetical protein
MTSQPQQPTTDDSAANDSATPDEGAAPQLPAGDDVRVGPDQSDEPEAGATEPTD